MTERTRTGTELYPFQSEDVRRIQTQFGGRCLVANEVGLGKTLTSLQYCEKYHDDEPGPVVIVVPAHLKVNWQREIMKHTGRDAFLCYHERVPSYTLKLEPNSYIVVNYDILVPDLWKSRMKLPPDSWAGWIKSLNPKIIIGDESHAIKRSTSQRTKAFRKLAEDVEYVLLLTGTPITNKPADLWPLLNILRPDLFPSEWDFLNQFSYMRHYWWGWQSRGAKELDVLNKLLLNNVMIRRLKRDVLGQLPPVTYQTVPIECDMREYRKAEDDFLGWLTRVSPLMARRAAKAEQLSKLNYLKQMTGRMKVKAVIEMIDDYLTDTDGKLLLGAIHHSVTAPILEAFKKHAVLVDGNLSDKQKNECFDRFNGNAKCRLLIGNLQAAGTGWSCRATSNVDIMEMSFTPAEIAQFIGRIDGINRGIPGVGGLVRFLVAPNTIDDDLMNMLDMKTQWANSAIDGGKTDLENVYQMVLNSITSRADKQGKLP